MFNFRPQGKVIGMKYKLKIRIQFLKNLKYSTLGSLLKFQMFYYRRGYGNIMMNKRFLHWLGN